MVTGACARGFQPGAGTVLARPPERRPVQEAQPLPGRHQPGAGQCDAFSCISQSSLAASR